MTARRPQTSLPSLLRSFVATMTLAAALALVPGPASAQTPELFDEPVSPLTPEVDANDAGQAAVAWSRPDGVRVLTTDRASGVTTAGAVSTTTQVNDLQVAVDDSGTVLVVWETLRRLPGYRDERRLLSDGVYAAIGQVGVGMQPAVRVVGPRADTGKDYDVAAPHLVTDPAGRSIIAGSDTAGTWVLTRRPGEPFGAQERAANDFKVTSTALAADGELLLTDARSRVITRPPGRPFSAPEPLPHDGAPAGTETTIAANPAGDAVALYRVGSQLLDQRVLTSRRAPDGTWGPPDELTSRLFARMGDVAMSGDGTAVATFSLAAGGFQRHTALRAATLPPGGPASIHDLEPTDRDIEAARGALDADASGRFSVAYTQHSPPFGPGDAFVAERPTDGLFGAPTLLTAGRSQVGNVSRVALITGGALAVFTDRENGEDRLVARWLPDGPSGVLDRAPTFSPSLQEPEPATPWLDLPPTLRLTTQPTRRPDRRDRILVGLRCVSPGQSDCRGTLRLVAGFERWTAARIRYVVKANTVRRVRARLTRRGVHTLRRQHLLRLGAIGTPDRVPGKVIVHSPHRRR